MRMVLIDFRHPFFRPMSRRLIVFGVIAAWTVFEFLAGSDAWGIFFAALGAYVGWGFFLSGQPDEPETPSKEDNSPPSGDAD
ncbi:DUF3329 domain-containing protein [Hoeflea sp.]|uniref:DUF3329 domain-containing protein n=1 Tax=Hoeflea sp. TaxID=1940281 RepID=UPI003B51C67E